MKVYKERINQLRQPNKELKFYFAWNLQQANNLPLKQGTKTSWKEYWNIRKN